MSIRGIPRIRSGVGVDECRHLWLPQLSPRSGPTDLIGKYQWARRVAVNGSRDVEWDVGIFLAF